MAQISTTAATKQAAKGNATTRFALLLLFCLSLFALQAQKNAPAKELIATGNSVYIEVNDINKNTTGAYEAFKKHLLGSEWNRWTLVENKEQANFICRLNIEKKGMNLLSAASMGARVRVITEILKPDGTSVWKSKRQQGNVSPYTGGDALSDAMRKVIRRSLKVELYGEKK